MYIYIYIRGIGVYFFHIFIILSYLGVSASSRAWYVGRYLLRNTEPPRCGEEKVEVGVGVGVGVVAVEVVAFEVVEVAAEVASTSTFLL